MSNPIHILMCFDRNYFDSGLVTMASTLLHSRSRIVFHIMFPASAALKREEIVEILGRIPETGRMLEDIRMHEADDEAMHRLTFVQSKGDYHTIASFMRAYGFEVLSKELDRVLYIDADLVVQRDLTPLANAPLDKPVVAILDIMAQDMSNRKYLPEEFRGQELGEYFNSGVMTVDLRYWERNKCLAEFSRILTLQDFPFVDQDAMNLVIKGNWTRMDDYWNWQYVMPRYVLRIPFVGLGRYFSALDEAAIVHYIGHEKPWKSYVPNNKLNRKYRDISDRLGFKLQQVANPKITGLKARLRTLSPRARSYAYFQEAKSCLRRAIRERSPGAVVWSALFLLIMFAGISGNPNIPHWRKT